MIRLLEGKNAVITGARRGIGHAIMELYAKNGANIWACSHSPSEEFEEDLKSISERFSVNIKPVYFDLSDSESIDEGIKTIISDKLEINILVNNAGITHRALFQMTSVQKTREVFDVDFFAPYQITQILSKKMVKNMCGASIINIASTAGLDANSGRAAYGSAKAALVCLTRVIAEELGPKNVRVNAIAPGITQTDMLTYSEEMLEKFVKESVLGEIGTPMDIANMALFLGSEQSSFITGQVLRVDGGIL